MSHLDEPLEEIWIIFMSHMSCQKHEDTFSINQQSEGYLMSTEHDRLLGGQGEPVWGHLLSVISTCTHVLYPNWHQKLECRLVTVDGHSTLNPRCVSSMERRFPLQNRDGEPTSK